MEIDKIPNIHDTDSLLKFIENKLKPKDIEKKQFGEVFTPIKNINEWLDQMPIEVWSDPNRKWFDPANGMGNFPIAVYLRLMKSLICIENISNRKKHILENMLYMAELNPKNVYITKMIFDPNNEYKLNIYCGDSLTLDIQKEFGVDKFDVIMGNPPYNKGGIRSHTGKQLGDNNETIWPKFISKSFDIIKHGGYMLFINPLSWLKKSHSLHNIILEKNVIWLKLWDDSRSKEIINADIPLSIYIVCNKLNNDNYKTTIISEIKRKRLELKIEMTLNKKLSIPLAYHSIYDKLNKFIVNNNLNMDVNTKTVNSLGLKIKIPKNYSIDDKFAIDTYTIKDGIIVKKAIENHPDANKRKLIIANKRGFKGAFIDDGRLSLTGNHKFYIMGDNLELILKLINFKICHLISDYLKYGQSFLDNEAFKYIPDIRKLNINDIDELDFYNLIGLSKDEINIIINHN